MIYLHAPEPEQTCRGRDQRRKRGKTCHGGSCRTARHNPLQPLHNRGSDEGSTHKPARGEKIPRLADAPHPVGRFPPTGYENAVFPQHDTRVGSIGNLADEKIVVAIMEIDCRRIALVLEKDAFAERQIIAVTPVRTPCGRITDPLRV